MMIQIKREALVRCAAEEILALVEDVESYPQFLPWCRKGEILQRHGTSVDAALEVAWRGLSFRFVTRNTTQGHSLTMELLEGPFRHLYGTWYFKPLREDACKVSLDLEFEMKGLALASPIFSQISGQLVSAFVARAYEKYGR